MPNAKKPMAEHARRHDLGGAGRGLINALHLTALDGRTLLPGLLRVLCTVPLSTPSSSPDLDKDNFKR